MPITKGRRKNGFDSENSDDDDESFKEESTDGDTSSIGVSSDEDFTKRGSRKSSVRRKKNDNSRNVERRQTRNSNVENPAKIAPQEGAKKRSNIIVENTQKKPDSKKKMVSRKVKKSTSRKLTKAKASNMQRSSDDSVDEVVSSDDSKDEDFEELDTSTNEDDNLDYAEDDESNAEDDESDAEDDESDPPSRKSKRVRDPPNSQQLRRSPRKNLCHEVLEAKSSVNSRNKIRGTKTSSSLFWEESSEASESDHSHQSDRSPAVVESPNRRNARQNNRVQNAGLKSLKNGKDLSVSSSQQSPRRASATKELKEISYKESSDSEDREDLPAPTASSRKKTRSQRFQDDDEEFVPNAIEEVVGSDSNSVDESLVDSIESNTDGGRVGYVEENIGDAYSDESDQEIKLQSPTQRRRPIEPRGKDDDYSDEESSEDEKDKVTSSPSIPDCPSIEDAITFEDLPKLHVCFFSPDNNDRQCFCLSTLRQIAISSAQPIFRSDLTGGKQTFRQPPHFRTPISDDLLDQIASRFGREALDIHGPYYNRPKADNTSDSYDRQNIDHVIPAAHLSRFNEQVRRYIDSTMGSRDLYACPLCYVVAHKNLKLSLKQTNQKENDSISVKYPTDFEYDPMAVLGYEDNEEFKIAAAFCFNRVSDLKVHLKNDHEVDTKKVQGNDFYARFKIRVTDGLLQRYLSDSGGSKDGGRMQRYWFEGNNYSFVQLLSQVSEARYYRQIIWDEDHADDEDDIGKAEQFFKPALDFFKSFSKDANKLWDFVSRPFQKVSQKEIKDFIADDDDDEEGSTGVSGYRAFDAKSALEEHEENKATAAYYNRFDESEPEYEESDKSEDLIDNSELVFEESSVDGDDDEWEQGILGKLETKLNGKRSGLEASHEKTPKRRISKLRDRSVSPVELDDSMIRDTSESGQSRNKFVLMDSDDETPPFTASSAQSDSRLKEGDALIPSPLVKRRLVIKESDEE